jgi:4-carboxymuconolactone decarboxylase
MAHQISRLPPLPDPLPAAVQELFAERLKRTGRILNVHHTFGHAPKLSQASMQMAMGLRYETSTPRLFIEIAIVRAAQLARGTYELQQHKPMLLAEGFSPAKLEALAGWRDSPLFDGKERALLAYVDEMADHGNVADATFERLGEFFTPQEILELSFAAGIYYGTALIMNALRIELEPK